MTIAHQDKDSHLAARRLRVGANYVPSRNWFYSWLDLDLDDIRRDFDDLADVGLDHVRVFPIWPWIQPNRGHLRGPAIEDVRSVLDAAHERGLQVCLDLLQGHLSSFDFLPSWVSTWHRRSVFTDAQVRSGLVSYVSTMCRTLGEHPALFAITTGNEVNNLWPVNETTPQDSLKWAEELVDVIRCEAPQVASLHSVFSDAWTVSGHPFTPAEAVDIGDWTTVHSWIFNGPSALASHVDESCLSWADYLVQLAVAATPEVARPVWLQEVGAPGPDVPAEQAADFARAVLTRVVDEPRLVGVTWWSSHDISRDLVDFPEREYDLGLFTVDHQRKPVAEVLADFAGRELPMVPRKQKLDIDVDVRAALRGDIDRRDELAAGSPFHRQWVQTRATGPVSVELA
ncbi:glycoside hydrolase 5 family protein [Austwickia chelonae]|uniref:glycoside hydrolase 5 family protein n=1 Tax=Austwickia chelonae TaxID=100225 RepID=UPI001F07E1DE|nr:glycosyl hydrolase [Austwickia chelonae]